MVFTDSKILLSNYPRIHQVSKFERFDGKELIDIQCGYDIQVDAHQVTLQIVNDLITAILAYDKVYIEGAHIWDVLQVFGSSYIAELLRADILHFIPDNRVNPVMMRKSDMVWTPGFFPYSSGVVNKNKETVFKPLQDEWSEIEITLHKNGISGSETQALLYLIDEKKTIVDQERIIELTQKETINDLKDARFATANSILRLNEMGQLEYHKLNILRLHELNTVAVTASLLGANALKTDGEICALMTRKCASIFEQKLKDGVSAIQSILRKKGFPDLGELFLSNVIGLEDVLKLRNSLQGRLFRYWAMTDEYDESQMQQDIMNSVHTVLGSKLSGAIRFFVCNAFSLIGSIPGLAISALDSFIVQKIAQGWHPNFFLDDKVKDTIDKCIKEKEDEEKAALLQERFKGVGRNDPCPCGSGKKFKKCCGR